MGEGFQPCSLWSEKKSNVLLALFISCSYPVAAILSLLPTHGTNSTLPSLVSAANTSTLDAPTPPPGFAVNIHYDTSKTFNPLAVYLSAVDCMYQFAQREWNERLDGEFTLWVEAYNVEIDVENHQGSHGLQLSTNHIVLGLYNTLLDVSAHSRFCDVYTTISLYGRQIGIIVIQEAGPRTPKEGETNSTGPILIKGAPMSDTMTYPSGHVTDSDDRHFSISYAYSGVRINSRDVFIAVLDALAISAQFSPSTAFGSLTAKSASGNCVINMVETDNPFQVNFSFVTKALRILIVDIMVRLRNFGELTLQLQWQAVTMAEGSIKLVDHGVTTV